MGTFLEARKAADEGLDLLALDILQKLTPWERVQVGMTADRLKEVLENAGQRDLAEFV